ncbi:MAG: arylsulfatase A-like enzyme [Planctomycetota bacterium]|jgi:arylsulfatase A-like enzyme
MNLRARALPPQHQTAKLLPRRVLAGCAFLCLLLVAMSPSCQPPEPPKLAAQAKMGKGDTPPDKARKRESRQPQGPEFDLPEALRPTGKTRAERNSPIHISAEYVERAKTRPNILLIMDDQHSARALGCAGNPVIRTPRLDQLAAEGAYFPAAYCNNPVCAPSRYSMFSGRYTPEIGALKNSIPPTEGIKFLAEHLAEDGYFTGLSGKSHFSPAWSTHGFQDIYLQNSYTAPSWTHYTPWLVREYLERGFEGSPHFWKTNREGTDPLDPAYGICTINPHPADISPEHWVTQMALRLMDEAIVADKPFFVNASYFAPHHPYGPLQQFYDLYEGVEIPLPSSYSEEAPSMTHHLTLDQYRVVQRHYYGFVSQVDHYIGELLDGLEERGLAEDTLVIMVSDHGDMMGEHNDLGKGVYAEGSVRIPFLLRWPRRVPPQQRIATRVSLIDVFPTVFDALHLELPSVARGNSLLPLVDGSGGNSAPNRPVFISNHRRLPYAFISVLDGHFKLVHKKPAKGSYETLLFNIELDPDETKNLASDAAYGKVLAELEEQLSVYWESQKDYLPEKMPEPVPRPALQNHPKEKL